MTVRFFFLSILSATVSLFAAEGMEKKVRLELDLQDLTIETVEWSKAGDSLQEVLMGGIKANMLKAVKNDDARAVLLPSIIDTLKKSLAVYVVKSSDDEVVRSVSIHADRGKNFFFIPSCGVCANQNICYLDASLKYLLLKYGSINLYVVGFAMPVPIVHYLAHVRAARCDCNACFYDSDYEENYQEENQALKKDPNIHMFRLKRHRVLHANIKNIL